MKEVLIACPMKREADSLRRQLDDRAEVLASGLGIKRTVPALLARFRGQKPELLIFTGSATQLEPTLGLGEVVVAEQWCLEEATRCFSSHAPTLDLLRGAGWEIRRRGLTLSAPVMRKEKRRELYETTGAVIFDSVTAAVLRVAETEGVPCLAPKIVAYTGESALMAFWQKLDENIRPLSRWLDRFLDLLAEERLQRPLYGEKFTK